MGKRRQVLLTNDRLEAFRLLAWQPADQVSLLPQSDLVRVLKRSQVPIVLHWLLWRLRLMRPRLEQVVVPRNVFDTALGDLAVPLSEGNPDIKIVRAENISVAKTRLESLEGRPISEFERVRPHHCVEVELIRA